MTSKERLLAAIHNETPDRLPATVHQWQGYHLDKYMNGISDLEAFKQVGLDAQIQYFEDMAQFWLVDADFTKLNTQEYEYYGFYHRIRQKLEQFWGLNIQEQANKIFKQGRSIASDSNLITGLTIRLNERGEIVDIVLKSTSGVKELDDAAVESFNQAGPFPNPPKGMLQNGKATIDWGFVVNT